MNSNVWFWVACCLLGAGACFHDVSALPDRADVPRVVRVTVRDVAGSPWPIESAPRVGRFELTLDSVLTQPDVTPLLHLVRGLAEDALIEDLATPPWREDTSSRLLQVSTELKAQLLVVRPVEPLEPGAQHSLVWLSSEGAQAFPVSVSTSPVAGAALLQSFPGAHARDVPTNLRRVLLRFDGHLSAVPQFVLSDAQTQAIPVQVEAQDCVELGFTAGDCIWTRWTDSLVPESVYTITSVSELRDATGAAVPAASMVFETAAGEDRAPPFLAQIPCALDEQAHAGTCSLAMENAFAVRAQANEPVFAELLALPARAASLSILDPLQIELTGLPVDAPCRFLRLSDLAENVLEIPLCLPLPQALAPLTIDEVRVDPLGPEPAQEYVELLNFGTKAVAVEGFSLTDDAFTMGSALHAQSPMLPGERALVVGPAFDRHEPSDGTVPETLRLIRLEEPFSLANDGSALFLRDATGQRLASAPRLAPERPGQCAFRVASADRRAGNVATFMLDPDGACTPGAASPAQTAASP